MKYEKTALGSDIAHDRSQVLARAVAQFVVKLLGLNKSGSIATEIMQAARPAAQVPTTYGVLQCRTGHGRLVWRAKTFFTEEPDTIEWLDQLQSADTLWDIGANVGMYAIYAAKFRKCTVHAFEPESQNYALLIDNIALNDVGDKISAASIALDDVEHFGKLTVPFITKGGAYNLFTSLADAANEVPETVRAARNYWPPSRIFQHTFASSIDDLVFRHGLAPPTHIKIDVDGNEYKIINGAARMLRNPKLKSILIELNEKSQPDKAVPGLLECNGFQLLKKRSVWDSKPDKKLQIEMPAYNAIFVRRNS